MQKARYKYSLISACLLSLLFSLFVSIVSAQSRPQVPEDYQKFFVHYIDNRSISEKTLNLVNLTWNDVGRSFALIAGVSQYPNMPMTEKELKPAAKDITKLQDYLKTYEFFDEIVVLKEEYVTTENLEFFLQTYFPSRLKKFPKSRFLFAYSGHGMTEGASGYLLKNTARSRTDKTNGINLGVVRVFVDEVVKSGHHVLVLLNSCYSGAFLRRSFGGPKRLIPKNPGAHAITAGGTGELTWHIPTVGPGSVFFEKVFAGLDKRADYSGDGLIGVYELFSYLKQEVQIFTNQDQNPQVGDLTIHGSKGEFFFLNRDRQVSKGILPEWKPETATPFGIKAAETLIEGREYYDAANYRMAMSSFKQSAKYGGREALVYIGYMYDKGQGVAQNPSEAVRWYRRAADAKDPMGMNNLGDCYYQGYGVERDYAKARYWFKKAADAGNARAMTSLGWMYQNGHGVPKDYDNAKYWNQRAADRGIGMAMVNMGSIYYQGLGVKKNLAVARHWYQKAADSGESQGMVWLGYLHHISNDYARARYWYKKAADLGNREAAKYLKELGGKQ